MTTEPRKTPPPGGADPERAKMMRVLIPSAAIALVVILVAVIASLSGGGTIKLSDGSDGSVDDPALQEITSGLKYRDIKVGDGKECPAGATVTVNYTGWLKDGTEFDSSKKQGGPVEFSLERVIPGWQKGIPGMKVGGKRKLVISPENGYGHAKKGPIPPDSTLVFEVELVSFKGGTATPIRPRRSPAPTDLTRMADGTSPIADDPNLVSIGNRGLKYRDIKVGDGPVAPAGAHVVMDYIGWRMSDGMRFDTSWEPGRKPLDMSLGGLIPGWQQGVPGMKVGGIRKLVIPPELGYGENGRGENIPPNATLVFEIELLGFR